MQSRRVSLASEDGKAGHPDSAKLQVGAVE